VARTSAATAANAAQRTRRAAAWFGGWRHGGGAKGGVKGGAKSGERKQLRAAVCGGIVLVCQFVREEAVLYIHADSVQLPKLPP